MHDLVGSPVMVNGDEYENIELRPADAVNLPDKSVDPSGNGHGGAGHAPAHLHRDVDNNVMHGDHPLMENNRNLILSPQQQGSIFGSDHDRTRDSSSGYGSESGDMLRELVKNKELMKTARRKNISKFNSMDSDISEGSTLVSTTSDQLEFYANDLRRGARIKHHAIRNVVSDSEMDVPPVVRIHLQ